MGKRRGAYWWGDPGIDGGMILKWIFKKCGVGH
jgi:hypothetical protein